MEGYSLGEIISVIKTDISEFVKTKMEYLKLELFEKTATTGSFLIFGLIVLNLIFFAFFFGFLALGFVVGGWVGSLAGGFGLVALLYVVILAVLYLCRKPLLRCLQNLFLKQLDPDLVEDESYEARRDARAGIDPNRKEDYYECD